MTFVMFGCKCGWHGNSLAELLSHKCDKQPAARPEPVPVATVATPQPAPPPAVKPPKLEPMTRTFNCPRCGKEVTTTNKRKKFCSHICAVVANQHAKAAAARTAKVVQADKLAQVVKLVKPPKPPRVYPKKPLWATGNDPPPEIQARLLGVSVTPAPSTGAGEMLPAPAEPQPRVSSAARRAIEPAPAAPAKVSPARRSRLESMFGQQAPQRPQRAAPEPIDTGLDAAGDVSLEPDKLARSGSTPVGADLTPNPSHPVRSSIKAASWRQLGPERAEPTRYCTCGMQIPLKPPERCENCGRPVRP